MADNRIRAAMPLPRQPHYINPKVTLLWVKRSTPLYGLLSPNVLREVCQFIAPRPMLVMASKERMIIFYLHTKCYLSLRLSNFEIQSEYLAPGTCVCIDDDQFFLCGGDTHKRFECSTYVIASGQGKRISDMQQGRCRHALYFHAAPKSVIAFGGNNYTSSRMAWTMVNHRRNRYKNSCEQYEVGSDSWTKLPDMIGVGNVINACSYQEKVFICEDLPRSFEIFNIALKEFTDVPIEINNLGPF